MHEISNKKKKKCVMFCKNCKVFCATREINIFKYTNYLTLPTAQIVSTGRDSFVREFNSISRNFIF